MQKEFLMDMSQQADRRTSEYEKLATEHPSEKVGKEVKPLQLEPNSES